MDADNHWPRLRLITYDHRTQAPREKVVVPPGHAAWLVHTWKIQTGSRPPDNAMPVFRPVGEIYRLWFFGKLFVRLNVGFACMELPADTRQCQKMPGVAFSPGERGYLMQDGLVGVSFDFVDAYGNRVPDEWRFNTPALSA